LLAVCRVMNLKHIRTIHEADSENLVDKGHAHSGTHTPSLYSYERLTQALGRISCCDRRRKYSLSKLSTVICDFRGVEVDRYRVSLIIISDK
jgi:hypothetical protein